MGLYEQIENISKNTARYVLGEIRDRYQQAAVNPGPWNQANNIAQIYLKPDFNNLKKGLDRILENYQQKINIVGEKTDNILNKIRDTKYTLVDYVQNLTKRQIYQPR